MTIQELQRRAFLNAFDKGFWKSSVGDPIDFNIAEKLALIHSEVSEALEELRDPTAVLDEIRYEPPSGKPLGFATELADVMIRVADLAERLGIDLEEAIAAKMIYNATRPNKHGKVF